MWEPAGLVMLESWSSGTPVVAARHGGIPEFMADDVGRLFDPQPDGEEARNSAGLADRIVEALELAKDRNIAQRCRDHASRFSWQALGPRIEQTYLDQ
jgi:glycosyltransferase involved in cell wall biosynthesis